MGNIKLVSGKGKNKGNGGTKSNGRNNGSVKKRRRGSGAKAAFATILVLAIVVAALTLYLGFYVKGLDTVLPNVWADGIKLSGMTLDEAKQALISEGYENNADNVAATIAFPDDTSFTITGNEAGFSLNAEDAAKMVYDYGRGGSFFENERAFIKAYLNRTDLSDLSSASFDEKFVRDVVAESTKAFNSTLINAAYDVSNDKITIIKGTSIEPADESKVYDLTVATLNDAMGERSHLTAQYTPETTAVQDVDLNVLYNTINVEPVSSVYDPETHETTASKSGITFDLAAAQTMLSNASVGEKVIIPLVTVEPEVTKDQAESVLFRDTLAETTTTIAGTSNRLNNITLAAAAINETILNPGDVFSFNGIVGQRTAAKGYKEAGAYVGGRTVQEIGGGICQVSSTTYNCVLYANLEVVERRAHGFTVAYLPLGNDATVDWGSIDFKFKNSTDYPIRIETAVGGRDGRELTVKLIGTKLDNNYIKIQYEQISTTPFKAVTKEDPTVPAGQSIVDTTGYTGYVVDTYKYLYDGDNNLISKTLVGRSKYNVQDRVTLVPVGSLTPTPDTSAPPSSTPGDTDTTTPPSSAPGDTDTTAPPSSAPGDADVTAPPSSKPEGPDATLPPSSQPEGPDVTEAPAESPSDGQPDEQNTAAPSSGSPEAQNETPAESPSPSPVDQQIPEV